MNGRNHQQGPVVGNLRHIHSAVLGRYFYAEAAQFGQAFHILIGNLGIALDDAAVDAVEELSQPAEKLLASRLLGVGRPG